MGKKSAVLSIILLILIQALLFTNLNKSRASDDEILAEINGEKITVSELKGLAKEVWMNISRKEDKKDLLDRAIEARLISQKAKEIGLHNDPEVKKELKPVRARHLGYSLKNVIEGQVTEQIAGNNYKDLILENSKSKVRFREIVVQSRPEAEQILKDILNGANFEQLAQERSINIYSKNGGDTGFIIKGKGIFSEQVENIIFKLASGQISEILKTREGYAIFKAVERKDLTQKDREEVIEALKIKLRGEKLIRLIERIRSQAKITIFSDNIKKIQQKEKDYDDLLQIELVNVNGTILKLEDMLSSSNNQTLNGLKSREFYNPAILETLIDTSIKFSLMVDEALRIGLDKGPKLKNHLKICEDSILAMKYIEDVLLKQVTCTDEEGKKFYDEYKDRPEYKNMPEYVHTRQILVDDEDLAKKIVKQLKNGGDFTEMATKYSMSMARRELGLPAGDFGYIKRDDGTEISKTEKDALFSLSIGEIKIIEMGFPGGDYVLYSIVKAEDKIDRGCNDYNKIKGLIKSELLKEKRKEKMADFIAQLKSEADIKIHLL